MNRICISVLLFFCIMTVKAQNIAHETISGIEVEYKIPQMIIPDSSSNKVLGIPHTIISLKKTDSIARIYLSILSVDDNSVIYSVNYPINSAPITDTNGSLLFEKINLDLKINAPNSVAIKPFYYELYTEDLLGKYSSVFKEIH